MKVRKSIQKDLRVPILFTSTALQRYLGQTKFSFFPSQKNEVNFFPLIVSHFVFKSKSMGKEECKKRFDFSIHGKEKQKCLKFHSNGKFFKKMKKYFFGFEPANEILAHDE